MKIVETVEEVRAQVKAWRKEGFSVGLVPTMGFLHEGHKSLIDRAVAENDLDQRKILQVIQEILIVMRLFVKMREQHLFSIHSHQKCIMMISLLLLI